MCFGIFRKEVVGKKACVYVCVERDKREKTCEWGGYLGTVRFKCIGWHDISNVYS